MRLFHNQMHALATHQQNDVTLNEGGKFLK